MPLQVTSPAFKTGDSIPAHFTCDGEDVSPPLSWTGLPKAARSLALICDDPDAPAKTWVHWVLYDLSPTLTGLPEGITPGEITPQGAKQGINDFRRSGYGGPCPPPGKPHRYYFTLYALDFAPGLPAGATKADLLRALEGHVLEQAQLVGLYQRSG